MEAERTGDGCRMPSDMDVEGGECINGPDWWRKWDGNRGKNRRWRGVVLGERDRKTRRERQKDTKREGEGGAWQCLRIEAVLRNMSERV